MKISILPSVFEAPQTLEFDSVEQFFEVVQSFGSTECKIKKDKLKGEAFCCALFQPGMTKDEGILPDSNTQILCYDIDTMTLDELIDSCGVWSKYQGCVYSTFKHTELQPRLRLMVALTEPITTADQNEYEQYYDAVANLLNIKYDPATNNISRRFFLPQHQPGVEPFFEILQGEKINPASLNLRGNNKRDAVRINKTQLDVNDITDLISKYKDKKKTKPLAQALELILQKERFAEDGEKHTTTRDLCFRLCLEFPFFDFNHFLKTYMADSLELMGVKQSDVLKLWKSAENKLKEKPTTELTDEQLINVQELINHKRLIVSAQNSHYVYDPSVDMYSGPFRGQGAVLKFRDLLAGHLHLKVRKPTVNGGLRLKTSLELLDDYGCEVSGVEYYAYKPTKNYNEKTDKICTQTYYWVDWESLYHPIADELLRIIGGDDYEQLEAYLTQFRNLRQPLPALTLVGPKGIWKTRICVLLSRFWGSSEGPTPCDALHVMRSFNGSLLNNPVVLSDEQLASTAFGRPQPELYRESITSTFQNIERKGAEVSTLISAVRHCIAVNDESKVFSHEVDASCVEATMERFLVLHPDVEKIEQFEAKWQGSKEIQLLRSGEYLCEHIMWLEENRKQLYKEEGRLFIQPKTQPTTLMEARYSDDTLYHIFTICFEKMDEFNRLEGSGAYSLSPIVCSADSIHIKPSRIADLWGTSKKVTAPAMTAMKIKKILESSGLILKGKRSLYRRDGRVLNLDSFLDFLEISEFGLSDELLANIPVLEK